MILLVVATVAIVVGFARGGRLDGLSRIPLRGVGAILSLFALQLFLRRGSSAIDVLTASRIVWLWCGVSLGLILLCGLNWRVPGMPLIALGIGLNLTVVLLNTGMPVGGSVAASFYMSPSARAIEGHGGFYRAVDAETVAAALGDVIPVPAPRPVRSLVSLGDLIMFLGAGVLIEESMTRARYRGRHARGGHDVVS
jgi:hypothetical protein